METNSVVLEINNGRDRLTLGGLLTLLIDRVVDKSDAAHVNLDSWFTYLNKLISKLYIATRGPHDDR